MFLWTFCNAGRLPSLPRRDRGAWGVLIAVAVAATVSPALGDALDGTLEVKSAYVNVDKDVFELHALIEYPVNDRMRDALKDGVTLTFDLDVNIARARRFWLDASVVDLTLRRELTYHTVSDRYLVRETRSGEQQSFASLEDALGYIGSVEGWPIAVAPQLSDRADYRVSVRAGVRRGRMPDALRAIMFWTDDWHRTSDWYSWSLPL
jgi:hypothetical protein